VDAQDPAAPTEIKAKVKDVWTDRDSWQINMSPKDFLDWVHGFQSKYPSSVCSHVFTLKGTMQVVTDAKKAGGSP
jgi:hypothetical protein